MYNDEMKILLNEQNRIDELKKSGVLKTRIVPAIKSPVKVQKSKAEVLQVMTNHVTSEVVNVESEIINDRVSISENKAVSIFGKRFRKSTLKNYNTKLGEQQIVLENCYHFLDRYISNDPLNLLLAGKSGTGKDHLLTGIAKRLFYHGYSVHYEKFYTIHDKCLQAQNETSSWIKPLRGIIRADVAMIGEVGMQSNTEFERKILYHIIDERYANNRPTIFTTNLTLDSFKNIVDSKPANGIHFSRTFERIMQDCIICNMNWESYRLKGN